MFIEYKNLYLSIYIFISPYTHVSTQLYVCIVKDRDRRLTWIRVTVGSSLPVWIAGVKVKIYGKKLCSLVQRTFFPIRVTTPSCYVSLGAYRIPKSFILLSYTFTYYYTIFFGVLGRTSAEVTGYDLLNSFYYY